METVRKERLINIQKLWSISLDEMREMGEFIRIDKVNNQFYRRLLLRNTFSVIETHLFILKELIIEFADVMTNPVLSWQELSILNEQKTLLDARGEIKLVSEFQKFEPNLRFILNLYSKVFNAARPDYGNHKFMKLIALNGRRNEVTHPKTVESLIISNQELSDIIDAMSWFIETQGTLNTGFTLWIQNYKPLE